MSSLIAPSRVEDVKARWQQRWSRFPKEALGVTQWAGQRRVVDSLQKHRKVAVRSGHRVGKTHLVGSLVLTFCTIYPQARVITTANTFAQVQQNVWGEIRGQYHAAPVALGGEMLTTQWKIGPKWEAIGLSTNEPDSFQGKHAPHLLIIFDECQGIDRDVWKAANSMMSGPDCYWLAIANPTRTSGPFFDACHSPNWHVERLCCLDHPNVTTGKTVMPGVTAEWVEEMRAEYGEDSPEWYARVLGDFPETDDYSLISLKALRDAESLAEPIDDGVHIGVDIARFGGDENVAAVVRDRELVHVEAWRGADLMQTTGRIIHLMEEHGAPAEHIHVDTIGIGAGVVDRLAEQGYGVDAVDFGAGPAGDWWGVLSEDDKVKNRRAELYVVTQRLIRDRALCIPPHFRRVVTDLSAPTYSFDSAGRLQIEKKEKIRDRIGRSPDYGDAVVMAMSREGSFMPRAWNA